MLKGEARPPKSPLKGMKYVVVSGGVLSGLGKGVTASSIGVLLKSAGLRVTAVKIDPYLNSDAGTMSPFEHGEVFVLDDGGEEMFRSFAHGRRRRRRRLLRRRRIIRSTRRQTGCEDVPTHNVRKSGR